ncbi:MAG: zinc ribbon domain-containing protein [Deltaproteobacteria bacterium]|nr:zinc ribbon domain-containing protein [Deltaproteobacteria bacterium]
MPIFEYLCLDCGERSEVLIVRSDEEAQCPACGTRKLKKLLSATSSVSGPAKNNLPGPGDTACCGSTPSQASCAGPGSCCGK